MSGLPSASKSPTATDTGRGADGEIGAGSEAAVAVAERDTDRAGGVVRGDEVELPVAVKSPAATESRRAGRVLRPQCERAVALSQVQIRGTRGLADGDDVDLAIGVEIAETAWAAAVIPRVVVGSAKKLRTILGPLGIRARARTRWHAAVLRGVRAGSMSKCDAGGFDPVIRTWAGALNSVQRTPDQGRYGRFSIPREGSGCEACGQESDRCGAGERSATNRESVSVP